MLTANLEAILVDLRPAAERLAARRRRRRRFTRISFAGLGASGLLATAAVGAATLLGRPAPPGVRADLRAVDQGMPADLRLNPDVAHAHSVAASGGAVVYFAALAGGGYCAELVTGGHPRGAVCSTAQETDATPLAVTIPFTDPVTERSPVTVSGHVSVPASTVELVYPDGGTDTAAVSPARFYVAEVPEAHLSAVHRLGLMLVARDADGAALAQAVVPYDAVSPPAERDRPHDALEVETVTDHGDFTRILRARGRVQGAARLVLRYPDAAPIEVSPHGRSFDIAIPPAQRGAVGELTAYAADGRRIATRTVAPVSYFRRSGVR
jgi:hypothetical protein